MNGNGQQSLEDLLRTHKDRQNMGDARVASAANDMIGQAGFISRSSVRNWSSGSSSRVNNWRQLAAIAAALRLDRDDANELMVAGGCDTIDALLQSARPEDARFLSYWQSDSVAEATTSPADESEDPDDRMADDPTPDASNRASWMLALAGVLTVLAVALGAIWLLGDDDTATLPPATTLDLPADASTVTAQILVAGTATHRDNVSHVELMIRNLDENAYWNCSTGEWQETFVRFVVPVTPEGGEEVTWQYRMPTAVNDAPFRARAWAKTSDGSIDPIGPQTNFTVRSNASVNALPDGSGADPDCIVVEENADDGFPRSTLDRPLTGEVVASSPLIEGTASDPDGVPFVELILKDQANNVYWNPEIDDWQEEFIRFRHPVSEPGATDVTWSFQVPVELEPGDYRARVWGRNTLGESDPVAPRNDFIVE